MSDKIDLNGKKLLVSTPAYDGKVPVEWMLAFNELIQYGIQYGVQVGIHARINSSLIPKCRDEIAHYFLFGTDADYLLTIDSDILWKPEDVLHMLSKIDKYKVIAGSYCIKEDTPEFFTDLMYVNGNVVHSDGLLRAKGVPSGFMMLSRDVLMDMRDKYKSLNYTSKARDFDDLGDIEVCALYLPLANNGQYVGEDIAFCRRLLDAGGRLWVDPEIELVHVGTKKYNHSYKDYLLKQIEDATEEVVTQDSVA